MPRSSCSPQRSRSRADDRATSAKPAVTTVPGPKGIVAVLGPSDAWALTGIASDGRSISIVKNEGACADFHHADVEEVDGGLRVDVVNRELIAWAPGSEHEGEEFACDAIGYSVRHVISLPRPLGEDSIYGKCAESGTTPCSISETEGPGACRTGLQPPELCPEQVERLAHWRDVVGSMKCPALAKLQKLRDATESNDRFEALQAISERQRKLNCPQHR